MSNLDHDAPSGAFVHVVLNQLMGLLPVAHNCPRATDSASAADTADMDDPYRDAAVDFWLNELAWELA